jgi:hypothetical protein
MATIDRFSLSSKISALAETVKNRPIRQIVMMNFTMMCSQNNVSRDLNSPLHPLHAFLAPDHGYHVFQTRSQLTELLILFFISLALQVIPRWRPFQAFLRSKIG